MGKKASEKRPNEALKRERQRRFWTQREVATELCNGCSEEELTTYGWVDEKRYSTWEVGKHKPEPFWQKQLCALFDKTPEELGFIKVPERSRHTPESTTLDEQLLSERSHPSPTSLQPSSTRHVSDSWKEPTPSEAIDRICEHLDAPAEDLVGEWLTLSGKHLVHLLANGWTIDAILETLRIVLKVVQAMPIFPQSASRRELLEAALQFSAATVMSRISLPEGRHVSAEQRTQLCQAFSESIAAGWMLFHTASTAHVLAVGQAQLTLLQQNHSVVYPRIRAVFYSSIYNLRGVALHNQERYEEALDAHSNAHVAALGSGDPWTVVQCLICQANTYRALGQHTEAIDVLEQALYTIGNSNNEEYIRSKAHLLACWADNAMMMRDHTTAQKKLEASAVYLDRISQNEEFDRASWLQIAGKNAMVMKDYTTAISHFKEALAELPMHWIVRVAGVLVPLAMAYARVGERDESIAVAKKAIPVISTMNAQMTNTHFVDYIRQDLLPLSPQDSVIHTFVQEAKQQLPHVAALIG